MLVTSPARHETSLSLSRCEALLLFPLARHTSERTLRGDLPLELGGVFANSPLLRRVDRRRGLREYRELGANGGELSLPGRFKPRLFESHAPVQRVSKHAVRPQFLVALQRPSFLLKGLLKGLSLSLSLSRARAVTSRCDVAHRAAAAALCVCADTGSRCVVRRRRRARTRRDCSSRWGGALQRPTTVY